jgi:myosin-light-chain kinase
MRTFLVSFLYSQEKGTLKTHDCVLIYESETEGEENYTPDNSLIRLTTKMLKVKRLEEINSCYSSNQLEKMAFFQCMGEVEKMKCFLEENCSDQDSRSGQNEVIVCGFNILNSINSTLFSHMYRAIYLTLFKFNFFTSM